MMNRIVIETRTTRHSFTTSEEPKDAINRWRREGGIWQPKGFIPWTSIEGFEWDTIATEVEIVL